MIYSRDTFTGQEIQDALSGRGAVRQVAFRFALLRNGNVIKFLNASGSVSYEKEREVKRTARLKVYDTDVNWLSDRIKPSMLLRMADRLADVSLEIMPAGVFDSLRFTAQSFDALNLTAADLDAGFARTKEKVEAWTEFPLGVYIPSTPRRTLEGGASYYDVEAFDLTVILQEDSLTDRLYFKAGTKYLDAVQSILIGAGINEYMMLDASDAVLPADREFEMGEKKLAVCNALLSEINFNDLECDADGRVMITRYREPSADLVSHIYRTDEQSIVFSQMSDEADYYKTPNVFIAVCSNPDLQQDYRSEYVNNNSKSILSTVRRGRRIVSEIYRPEMITSQKELDEYVRRKAFEASQVYRKIQIQTALVPTHGNGDVILLDCGELKGVHLETAWSMELTAGAQMSHTLQKLAEM